MSTIILFLLSLGLPPTLLILSYNFLIRIQKSKRDLQNKVVFISGASSGVGEALAHCFYSVGCKVVLAARRKNELERVKNALMNKAVDGLTYEPTVICLDLKELDTLSQAIQKTLELHGQIDILINNGGISCRGNVLETEINVHKDLMSVNYFGPIVLTRAVLPKMIDRKSGHIVFVSSIQGRMAIPDRAAYSASKHACQAFADALRAEISKHNINVSVISPGYIRTALSINALTGTGDTYGEMDSTTAAGYEPAFVATKILEMVVNNNNELVLTPISHKVALFLRYFAPSIYFWIMSKRAK